MSEWDAAGEPVGSLGEEAAKLLGALAGWAQDQRGEAESGVGAVADQAARAWREVADHVATDSAECRYCPICRAVHAVRETPPEVRAQLAVAATALMQAAAGLLSTATPDDRSGEPRASGVEHIDLDHPDESDPS